MLMSCIGWGTVLYDDGQGSDGSYGSNKCCWCELWWWLLLVTFQAIQGCGVASKSVICRIFLAYEGGRKKEGKKDI